MGDGLGVGVRCVGSSEGEVEEASRVLWPDRACDAEAGTLQHLQPLRLALRNGAYEGTQSCRALGGIEWRCLLCCT